MAGGIKHDQGKPRTDLLPPLSLLEVAKVLEFGARKYAPDNWRKLDDLQSRYIGGALRHILAYQSGEENDPESGFPHIAHALCCLHFVLEDSLLTAAEVKRASTKDS